MRLNGVDPSCPNPSTPWRRCRHKSLTDRLKPSDECCQNYVSWTDTSTALLCGETERFSACSVEQNLTTTYSCAIWQNEANFSQFIQYLTNTNSSNRRRRSPSLSPRQTRILQCAPSPLEQPPRRTRGSAKARRLLSATKP